MEILVTRTDGLQEIADTDMPVACQTCPSRSEWGCLEYFRGIESASKECCVGCDCSRCEDCIFADSSPDELGEALEKIYG